MKLVYVETGNEVQVGDTVKLWEGEHYIAHTVTDIAKPLHGGSTGRVYLRSDQERFSHGLYPSVIDAKWIEREDQDGTTDSILKLVDGFGTFTVDLSEKQA